MCTIGAASPNRYFAKKKNRDRYADGHDYLAFISIKCHARKTWRVIRIAQKRFLLPGAYNIAELA